MTALSPDGVAERPCLLLIDDTPANLDVLVGLLKDDYELKVALRGAKGLELCASGRAVDLVLLDVMMPEMDGFAVCRALRADPATRDIPVIFLTAKSDVDATVRGFAEGADDYVTKPFRPTELQARVRTHLTLRTQSRELDAKNTELKSLLQIVGHDVANQFAAVQMLVDVTKRFPDRSFAEFLPHVEVALRNGIGLTSVIRELRASEDKQLPLAPVALRAAVDEAVLLASARIEAKGIVVTVEVPDVTVMAERSTLTVSVIGNALSNAIKFSPAGGTITLAGDLAGEAARLRVSDAGDGIDASALVHLFDVTLSRSRLGTAREQGTGFGMPLMQRFVTQYGGRVDVASRTAAEHPTDHGTHVTLWLPLARGA